MLALIETWTSTESLDAARRTPAYPVLERFERNLTLSTLDCGAFAVPMAGTDDRHDQAISANPDAPAPATAPCTTPLAFDAPSQRGAGLPTQTYVQLPHVEALDEVRELPFPFHRSVERRLR